MKSFFNQEAFDEIWSRMQKLSADSNASWGKMNVGQMMHHCQGPLNIILGKNHYGFKPSWLAKIFFKKSLYNDKSWRKNLPTAKALRVKDQRDFETETAVLNGLMQELFERRDQAEWEPHPAFGYFTKEQWGKMQYKHLDHHFRQFGA